MRTLNENIGGFFLGVVPQIGRPAQWDRCSQEGAQHHWENCYAMKRLVNDGPLEKSRTFVQAVCPTYGDSK